VETESAAARSILPGKRHSASSDSLEAGFFLRCPSWGIPDALWVSVFARPVLPSLWLGCEGRTANWHCRPACFGRRTSWQRYYSDWGTCRRLLQWRRCLRRFSSGPSC